MPRGTSRTALAAGRQRRPARRAAKDGALRFANCSAPAMVATLVSTLPSTGTVQSVAQA